MAKLAGTGESDDRARARGGVDHEDVVETDLAAGLDDRVGRGHPTDHDAALPSSSESVSGTDVATLRYRPTRWNRDHRVGLIGITGATLLCLIVGALGPSVVTIKLSPRDGFLPPWYLPKGIVHPNEWLVSVMIWVAIGIGGIGLWVCLRALADGWRPRVRRLITLGIGLVTATILVPPLTSADVLMYAAYGRLQVIGRSPYETTPMEIFSSQYDPVMHWAERPWTNTPSVYGPITSWTQWLANVLGGTNMHDIVFWLQVLSALPFVLACLGIIFIARNADPERLARAALLTICNPLLIWAVVAGAHNEAMSAVFAVAGLIFIRKSPFLAGLGVGLAGCAKLSIGLWGIAMLWAYRRQPKQLLKICAGAAIPMILAYGFWEPNALFQVLRNGGYIGTGTWVAPLYSLSVQLFGHTAGKIVVGVLSYLLLPLVIFALSKVLPWQAAPGTPTGVDPKTDPMTVALRTAIVLGAAWVCTAMYSLSWYDLMIWLPLGLVAGGKLDRLLILRGVALSAAYVPGRAIEFGASLGFVAARFRDIVSPAAQILVLIAIFIWWKYPDREPLWRFWRDREDRSNADAQLTPVPAADEDHQQRVAAS
ncbi:hypothetical protein FOE78_02570 [Microlunatus elymi]|uniref:Alpha-1,6-mannosyltransferase n=1 Tax=Microlunatus elymi TaxID=2596828 RepID=A0A516PUS2_9ACTN|nr:polyprenol phosphomannose-dependent alpha 1,6 mannosyltransferase MptB [Microlunatus elymi]QDP94946.1 hypothetical protein FOE78_02570 [Microlunatus elymi]